LFLSGTALDAEARKIKIEPNEQRRVSSELLRVAVAQHESLGVQLDDKALGSGLGRGPHRALAYRQRYDGRDPRSSGTFWPAGLRQDERPSPAAHGPDIHREVMQPGRSRENACFPSGQRRERASPRRRLTQLRGASPQKRLVLSRYQATAQPAPGRRHVRVLEVGRNFSPRGGAIIGYQGGGDDGHADPGHPR
jgi:hypothetical protein